LKKIKKYSRSGNKREIREIVEEEIDKVERTRKPRNGSRKKVIASDTEKSEGVRAVINNFTNAKNLVKVGNDYLYFKDDNSLGFTKDKDVALLFTEFTATRFCIEYKIKNYILESLWN